MQYGVINKNNFLTYINLVQCAKLVFIVDTFYGNTNFEFQTLQTQR